MTWIRNVCISVAAGQVVSCFSDENCMGSRMDGSFNFDHCCLELGSESYLTSSGDCCECSGKYTRKKPCGDAYLILYITILSLSVEKNDINCVSLINIRALLWLNLYPHPLCGLAFALLATPHC